MQVGRKWNDFRAGVKYHASHPLFTGGGCQRLQTTHIVAAQSCSSFDLYSNDPACAIFQNDIHFLP